ncbi:MAG: hypothetical protein KF703_05300 [Actinobacteria bacterium]|nr:hypothetical protein [Actinomycetota bacterium]
MNDTTGTEGDDDGGGSPVEVGAKPARPTNEDLRGPRPLPSVPSLAGTAAGAFLVFGLFALLDELGDDARLAGIGISLVFEVLGVVLLQFSKGRRSATAGGTIAAVAVIPLLGYLFVDTPGDTVDSAQDVTGPVAATLVVAALVWFCAWYFGPGRRYAFFLAAACLALWAAAQVQIVSDPIDQVFGYTSAASTFTPIGPSSGYDPYEDYPATTSFSSDDFSSDDFSSDDFSSDDIFSSDDYDYDYDYGADIDDPSTKLGVISLLFGCAYLLAAARRDRLGDTRAGTALFAVATPILVYAVAYLGGDLGSVGTSVLALALGAVGLWLGTRTGRRFTSWVGTAACVFAVLDLVEHAVGDSPRASAAVLVVIGLAIAIGVGLVEQRREVDRADGEAAGAGDDGAPGVDPGPPPGPGMAF